MMRRGVNISEVYVSHDAHKIFYTYIYIYGNDSKFSKVELFLVATCEHVLDFVDGFGIAGPNQKSLV